MVAIMPSNVTIRPAVERDLTPVLQLLSDAHLPLDGIAKPLVNFVVAETDGVLIGVAGLERCGPHGLLRSVAVTEMWRSQAIGRGLVGRVITMARAQSMAALYLLTTSAEDYFTKLGFRPIARELVPRGVRGTVEFQHACPASATVMVRPLGSDAE